MRDCIISILSEYVCLDDKLYLRVLISIDVISLMLIDGNLENLDNELVNLRARLLQTLCLEKLFKDSFDRERDHVSIETFQNEKCF